MKRREFISLLGGAAAWPLVPDGFSRAPAGAMAWLRVARAQQAGKVYRVALVFTTSSVSEMVGPDPIHPFARTFVHSLHTLGYLQGQNLAPAAEAALAQRRGAASGGGFFILSQSGERPERYADLKRITPQVVAVQLDQVEGV